MVKERCITYDKKFKKYRVRVQRGYKFNGQPNKKNGTADTLQEARALRTQFEYELSRLDGTKACNVTLDVYAKDFFERKAKDGYAKKYTVNAQYQKYLNHISPRLGKKLLDEIKPRDIKNLIGYLQENIIVKRKGILQKRQRLANNTISISIFPLIKDILNQARIDEYIKRNPAEDIKKPKITEGTVKPFTIDEWERIKTFALQSTNPNMRIGIPLLYYTACRKGEILGLQWKCIDFINGIIIIDRQYNATVRSITEPKTPESNDTIPLANNLKEILLREFNRKKPLLSDYIICPQGNGKKPLSHTAFDSMLDTIERNTGVEDVNAHRFRHFAATISFEEGADCKSIQTLLRHKNPKTTMSVYMDSTPKSAEPAINALEKLN